MVTELNPVPGKPVRLVVEPNRSLSREGSYYFLLSILVLALFICAVFALMGVWVVLPFAALEIALLVSIFYYVNHHLHTMEVISIDDQHVLIEKGDAQVDQRWDFQRTKVRVVVQAQHEPTDCESITISGDQGIVALGDFLNEEECEQLINSLKRSGLMTINQGPLVAFQF